MIIRERADDMGEFMQNNTIWITPVISIVLTIVIKISAKPEFLTLERVLKPRSCVQSANMVNS